MKIAIVAPIEEAVPPKKYGGTEWVIYYIAHGLAKRGHTVDLYASGDSLTNAGYNLIPIIPQSLHAGSESNDSHWLESQKLLSVAKAAKLIEQGDYDLVNNHARWRFLLFSPMISRPIVTTDHMPLTLPDQKVVYLTYRSLPHIALSNNQREGLPELNFLATIYNGIDLNDIPSDTSTPKDDLLFLGRISKDKGAIEAVAVAKAANKRLRVAAKTTGLDPTYVQAFMDEIDPALIAFIGEVAHDEGLRLMQRAKALIMPVQYEDPCPLVPLEAMACGIPVIAYARGALPEQIVDGVTGFLINQSENQIRGNFVIKSVGVAGLKEAVDRLYALSPAEYQTMTLACRKHIQDKFTVKQMVDHYEQVFSSLVTSPKEQP